MASTLGTASATYTRYTRCSNCGHFCLPRSNKCSQCNETLTAPAPAVTGQLSRRPLALPIQRQGSEHFALNACAWLQFLPSGICISLPLQNAEILGRATARNKGDVLDLSALNADWHGVSREHCLLRRQGTHLILIDLNSTNGTYLNGEWIIPYQDYVVADGDHVILGTLHLVVFFGTSTPE